MKSIHDPLYGFIDLDETELNVIDSPTFRRLHRLKQLGQAYAVYPSAQHTRFEHSLGVCHLAGRVARTLGLKEEAISVVRLAGLLHDVGHGPFSHLFEEILAKTNGDAGINHETISRMIIHRDSDISGILGEAAEKVACILEHSEVPGWNRRDSSLAAEIISGPLDVDRMDYLRRDSYHLGISYGRFDLDQLIHTITGTVDDGNYKIGVGIKGWGTAEQYVMGRYLMHAQVYQHHSITVANKMCQAAVDMANDAGIMNNLSVTSAGFLGTYLAMDDQSLTDTILGCEGPAQRMMERVRSRDLLKRCYELYPDTMNSHAIMGMSRTEQKKMEAHIAEQLGLEIHDIMVHISTVDHHKEDILVTWKDKPYKLREFFPVISDWAVNKFYVFGPDDTRKSVRQASIDYIQHELGVCIN